MNFQELKMSYLRCEQKESPFSNMNLMNFLITFACRKHNQSVSKRIRQAWFNACALFKPLHHSQSFSFLMSQPQRLMMMVKPYFGTNFKSSSRKLLSWLQATTTMTLLTAQANFALKRSNPQRKYSCEITRVHILSSPIIFLPVQSISHV